MLRCITNDVLDRITDDVILGLCFEVHRAVKLNMFSVGEQGRSDEEYEVIEAAGYDVFGNIPKHFEELTCECPLCNKEIICKGYSRHLLMCMGISRASKAQSNKQKQQELQELVSDDSDVSDAESDNSKDSDWESNSGRKPRPKKKKSTNGKNASKGKGPSEAKGKNAGQKKKNTNGKNASKGKSPSEAKRKNGDLFFSSESSNSLLNSAMTVDQKRAFLLRMCGVSSEHTGKMCMNTLQCRLHNDEERRNLRFSVLGRNFQWLLNDDHHISIEDESGFVEYCDTGNAVHSPAANGTASSGLKKREKKGKKGSSQSRGGKRS